MSKSSPKQHLSTRAAARAAASSMADTWVRLAQAVVILVIGTAVFALLSFVPGFGARPTPSQGSTTWNVVWPNGHTGFLVE